MIVISQPYDILTNVVFSPTFACVNVSMFPFLSNLQITQNALPGVQSNSTFYLDWNQCR